MSTNAPCEQSSCTAHIVEIHPALQVADKDDNPTMDRDLVAPTGGPPGDNDPGGDPGDDDLNNLFNDDKVEDQLNQLDPGLIVFSNLVGAINALAHNAQRNSKSSSSHTHVHKPDTFNGTDPKKLHAFWCSASLTSKTGEEPSTRIEPKSHSRSRTSHMGNFKVLASTEFNSKEKCRIISSKIAFSTSYNFTFGGVV